MTRIALVPGCLALRARYASLADPVADLRAACRTATCWLGREVAVLAGPQGRAIAAELLASRAAASGAATSCLVVANGSARRTEQAPGHLDTRAPGFDDELRRALTAPDPAALRAVDLALGARLWADVAHVPALGTLLAGAATVSVDYDDDPYGVQYWVLRWETPPG